jgi:hypothetical protein
MIVRAGVGKFARRWYIVALGVVLTSATVAYVSVSPGVYWARSQVVLLGPPVPARPNKLNSGSGSLIATAGLIEREVNFGRTRMPATSNDVALVDLGVYDGEQVRLPNNGGQWASNFDEPVLDVQASGPSAAIVRRRIDSLIAEISTILERRQDDAGVTRANKITLAISPQQVQVNYATGDRRRAASVLVLLGMSLTTAAVLVLEARRDRGRTRQGAAGLSIAGDVA